MPWKYRPWDPEVARRLALAMDKPMKYGDFLAGRGFEEASEVQAFMSTSLKDLPDPLTMPGMEKAVAILGEARGEGALVAISGDFDVDGLTATALLKRALGDFGFRVVSRIPNRIDEGYGLSPAAVGELHDMGATYLITVDSGVSDAEAVLEAGRLGMKVIITDHHHLPPSLPAAAAIINPHLGGGWEDAPLAGVGVAFMLAGALRRSLGEQRQVQLIDHLALVALGTIADLAPLLGPNRTMVRNGLKVLLASEWPGLAALRRSLRLDGQPRISVRDVGFKMGPRLNAAGRLGSAGPALDILMTEDPVEASRLARQLDALNKVRYDTQASLVEEAMEMLEIECLSSSLTVVLAKEGWPKGILGLAASRLAERSGKPTVMLTIQDGVAMGSGRTAGNFDLFGALSRVRHLCLSMGGHSQAAGLKVPLESLDGFREAFERAAGEQSWSLGQNDLLVDMVGSLPDLAVLARHLPELEPYGQGHPAPVIAIQGLNVLHAVCSRTGRVDLRLSDGLNRLNVSGFNLASRLEEVGPVMDVAVVFDPESSGYGNIWRLVDFRPSGQDS